MFYNKLYTTGVTNSQVFACYYTDSPETSFFTLGGYDTTSTYYKGTIKWMAMEDHFFWQGPITGVSFDDTEYKVDEASLIFDTGTSLAYMPNKYFNKFISKVTDKVSSAFKYDGIYWGPCKPALYPTLGFLVSGKWIEIHPETYLIDVGA